MLMIYLQNVARAPVSDGRLYRQQILLVKTRPGFLTRDGKFVVPEDSCGIVPAYTTEQEPVSPFKVLAPLKAIDFPVTSQPLA